MALPHVSGEPDGAAALAPDARAVLTASAIPTFLIDPRGSASPIVFANPAFLALTGREREEMGGGVAATLLGPSPDRAARAALDAALEGDKPGSVEILALRKGGAAFWAEISAAPVAGAGLTLVQVLDVTRRRDAEDALALSRQREALGLLTNSVAHEFNNFLQILIGYIDGLKRRLGDTPDPFVQRAVIRSTDAAERAAILTRQLLAFSRRIAPEVRPVDLNALVTAFAERSRATLPARIDLVVRPEPNLACAMSNPIQVELALSHILANSCEAMPRGGSVTIATHAIAAGDRGLGRPGEGAVAISITDSGHGMSPEMAARALAPFATSREAGRGAGLAIVHGLMKRQGGVVSIEAKTGEAKTGEAKTGEAKTGEAKTGEAKTGEGVAVRLVFPAAP